MACPVLVQATYAEDGRRDLWQRRTRQGRSGEARAFYSWMAMLGIARVGVWHLLANYAHTHLAACVVGPITRTAPPRFHTNPASRVPVRLAASDSLFLFHTDHHGCATRTACRMNSDMCGVAQKLAYTGKVVGGHVTSARIRQSNGRVLNCLCCILIMNFINTVRAPSLRAWARLAYSQARAEAVFIQIPSALMWRATRPGVALHGL